MQHYEALNTAISGIIYFCFASLTGVIIFMIGFHLGQAHQRANLQFLKEELDEKQDQS